ncbi:MAG: hypothetical protein ACE5DN_01905 [Flavobacteriales bacterium]
MRTLIFYPLLLLNVFSGEHDFRTLNWGMTIKEVIQAETLKLESQIGSELRYSKTLSGIDCSLIYYFTQGRLSKAAYTSKESYTNFNDYIEDYKLLKGLLEKKYGTAASDKLLWSDEQNKVAPDHFGNAVATGQLQYEARWSNKRTRIAINLNGNNNKCRLTITYEAVNTKWNTQGQDAEDTMDEL